MNFLLQIISIFLYLFQNWNRLYLGTWCKKKRMLVSLVVFEIIDQKYMILLKKATRSIFCFACFLYFLILKTIFWKHFLIIEEKNDQSYFFFACCQKCGKWFIIQQTVLKELWNISVYSLITFFGVVQFLLKITRAE